MALLKRAAHEHFGTEPLIQLETNAVGTKTNTVASVESRERTDKQKEAIARAKEHPRIAEAAEILGARLKEIRLPED